MAKAKHRFLSGFLAASFMAATPGMAPAQSAATAPAPIVQTVAPAAQTPAPAPQLDVADMIAWRHDIHAHPETAFEETRTAAKVEALLKSWGIETHTNIGGTGVVGVLRGQNTGPNSHSICMRAELDALPMTETTTGLDYVSTVPGKAHTCGHDAHMAMLLGAAKYLSETKNFTGTVYFIFQPAEEKGGGAKAMIDDGLFNFVHCDMGIYGMHDWPGLKAGQIGISEGNITAASDDFSIKITGKGGHAAYPADNIDAISLASDIVKQLHQYANTQIPASDGAVLAITMLHGGEAVNVMPEKVEIDGTARTFNPATQDKLAQAIQDISQRVAASYGAKVEVQYNRGYPSVFNSHDQTENAKAAAAKVVGADNVVPFARTMGGEDFSYYTQLVPGAYIALGQWDGKSPKVQLHSPNFNFNDATIATGANYWIKLVETELPLVTPPPPPAAPAPGKPPAP
jgi:hippurate hydrolase